MGGGGYPWTPLTDAQKAGGTSPFKSAEGVLTSPNDLDLGMLEALGITPGAARPAFQGASWGRPAPATTGYTTPDLPFQDQTNRLFPSGPTSGPSLGGPLGPAPAPGSSDPGWFSQMTGGVPSTSMGWDMQDAATRSSIFRPVAERIDSMDAKADDWSSRIDSALGGAWNAVTGAAGSVMGGIGSAISGIDNFLQEPSVWTGERPTVLEGRGVNPAQAKVRALGGSASEAERYISGLQAQGDDAGALQFAEMYAEDTGVDLFGASYDPSGPVYDDAGEMTPAASYGEMSPADRDQFNTWYNDPAVQEHYGNRALEGRADPGVFKDFAAVQHFVSTLPSAAEVEAQAVKNVTQADVDAYLKELDAMSDEDYNALVKSMGLSSTLYKGTAAGADANLLTEGKPDFTFTKTVEKSGSLASQGYGPDAESVFNADMARIVKEVAAAKSTCLLGGGTWGVNGCEPGEDDDGEEDGEEDFKGGDGRRRGYGHEEVDEDISGIFGDLTTAHQESEIRRRMAELGTTDLTQLIRDEFATITTPDYAADILTAHESMRTAVSDAATERSDQLEAATTRAEGRIAEIKSTLTGELQTFEVDRVEQQTALKQKVIDRTTDMELALTERLTDIRAELGDQVTDEFESVAALAGTLVSSQATSSRDAMSRLGQIADMAAAARLAAPVELSAEALTALGDLEFQIENQIAQAKADTTAQINIEQASAILNETMRQGGFETEKQRALVEATLTEALRGTVYEDRVQEMMAEALLQEDQYVRQFTEAVDRSEAQAKLQNLFGTQEYERQLDMMNLTRDWQTADALQGRDWQTTDMTRERRFEQADYAKALADQQAAALLNRGYQTDDYTKALGDQRYDYDTALIDQRYDASVAEQQRQADVQSALAENAVGDDPLSQMKAIYPGVSDELYTTAMAIAEMPNMRESSTSWQNEDPRTGDKAAEFDGTVVDGGPNRADGKRYFVTEYGGLSDAEAYLRTLGEGKVISGGGKYDPVERTPSLSAGDYASLRALVDMARHLIERRNQAQYDASGAQYDWLAGGLNPTADYDAYLMDLQDIAR